jgi:hypothetical protein
LWIAVSEYGVSKPVFFKFGIAVNKDLRAYLNVYYTGTSEVYPKTPQKGKKSCFGPIRTAKNLKLPKKRKTTKLPTATADQKFLG